jgi:phage-related holin
MKELHILPKFMLAGITDESWLKVLIGLSTGLLNYLLPTSATQQMVMAAAILIMLDTFTGVMASESTGKAITSAKFGRVIVKFIGYAIAVSVVGLAANTVPGGKPAHEFLTSTLIAFIICTEGISIFENLDRMGVPLPKSIVKWLRGRKKDFDNAKEE